MNVKKTEATYWQPTGISLTVLEKRYAAIVLCLNFKISPRLLISSMYISSGKNYENDSSSPGRTFPGVEMCSN